MRVRAATRRFFPSTKPREHRLRTGIRLVEAALTAGISLTRASQIEREPELARPGELERLRAAVEKLAGGAK